MDNEYMKAIAVDGLYTFKLTLTSMTPSNFAPDKWSDAIFEELGPKIRVSVSAVMAKDMKIGDSQEAEVEVKPAKDVRYKNYYLKRFGEAKKTAPGKGFTPKSKEEIYAGPLAAIMAEAILITGGDVTKALAIFEATSNALIRKAGAIGQPVAVTPATTHRAEPQPVVSTETHETKSHELTPAEIQAKRVKWLESIGMTALDISDFNSWCASNVPFATACARGLQARVTSKEALYKILQEAA